MVKKIETTKSHPKITNAPKPPPPPVANRSIVNGIPAMTVAIPSTETMVGYLKIGLRTSSLI